MLFALIPDKVFYSAASRLAILTFVFLPFSAAAQAGNPADAIKDLSVDGTQSSTVSLRWSHVSGAATYEIRYDIAPITEQTWRSGSRLVINAPKSGGVVTATVYCLSPARNYYAAVKSTNSAGAQSLISNLVNFQTRTVTGSDNAGKYLQPTDIRAWVGDNDDLNLSWRNSADSRFDRAAIIRSSSGPIFSYSASAGASTLYDGAGSVYTDMSAGSLPEGQYYYSIFGISNSGTISPPVIVAYNNLSKDITIDPLCQSYQSTSPSPASPTQPSSPYRAAQMRPSGTVFKYAFNDAVYLLEDGRKRLIPNFDLYRSAFSAVPIVILQSSEQYPDGQSVQYGPGSLLQAAGEQTVWLVIDDGTRYPFRNYLEFTSFGYRPEMIQSVSGSVIETISKSSIERLAYHPEGSFVRYNDSPTVYRLEGGVLRPIGNRDVLASYGGENKVLTVQAGVFQYPFGARLGPAPGSVVRGSGHTFYVVGSQALHPFKTFADFIALGYNMTMLKTVSEEDLSVLPIGSPVE